MSLQQLKLSKENALDVTRSSYLKDIKSVCVDAVGGFHVSMTSLFHYLFKGYYQLTAAFPRRMPSTPEEFEKTKSILINYFGLDDRPDIWLTVCGQLTGTKATSIRKPYKDLANAAKRLNINLVAHNKKLVAISELNAKLELVAKQMADEEALKNEPEASAGNGHGSGEDLQGWTHPLS